jgi:hypothetical protein
MLALETRDLNLVQEFLNMFPADRRRAILQEQTRSGDTCLHIAAGLSRISSQDKERLLRFLVIQGANGNVTNNVKELPRDFARKEVSFILLLLVTYISLTSVYNIFFLSFIFYFLLAHLSQSDRVSFCDRFSSGVHPSSFRP